MWERFGQLAKGIVRRALDGMGGLKLEHEVPVADAQSGDVYFVPTSGGDEAERALLGLLGSLTREPCLLEMIQRAPGPVDVRQNIRKQLTLDHAIALEAQKDGRPRPPLLRLWQITTGRPRAVLEGYGLRRAVGKRRSRARARDASTEETWPRGVWVSSPLYAMGLVVLRELPRRRDTLLLRLLGRGRVLTEAIADLEALPEDAKEREVAMPPLIALRFQVKQNPRPEDEEKVFLMATEDLYEQWVKRVERSAEARGLAKGEARGLAKGEARGLAKGEARGLAKGEARGISEGLMKGLIASLAGTYEERFGPMPVSVRRALGKAVTLEAIGRWTLLFATASAKEISAAVRKGAPPE